MQTLTAFSEWKALQVHHEAIAATRVRTLFELDPQRTARYRYSLAGVMVDLSCQPMTSETIQLLCALANRCEVSAFLRALFSENMLNVTERRAVWHPMLRSPQLMQRTVLVSQAIDEMQVQLKRLQVLCEEIRSGIYQGREIRHVINIGVGGSDLGARMVLQALEPHMTTALSIDFISNLDPTELSRVLDRLDPAKTLLIIASKSFTTYETLLNAQALVEWLGGQHCIATQCLAITANAPEAMRFGIVPEHILPMWDWVGGRYSIWSAIGFPVAIGIGFEAFQTFLAGAAVVDEHVLSVQLHENIPLLMALLDCWQINFFKAATRAIIPYAERLGLLIPYLQQLVMESNGKSVDLQNRPIDYETGPIIWGGIGCSSQHAFHQLLMQGTQRVPVDFIAIEGTDSPMQQFQQTRLNQQLYAQSRALLQGNLEQPVDVHRQVPGNVPHLIIQLTRLTPHTLGTLLALYEYRTMLTACIWQINPFDQFGVELGKGLLVSATEGVPV